MSTICLKVEAFAGTTIEDACRDLCALADRVGVLCEVGFNGVKLWAYPGTDPAQLAKAWAVQMERPEQFVRLQDRLHLLAPLARRSSPHERPRSPVCPRR
jgi:hypothetical protein